MCCCTGTILLWVRSKTKLSLKMADADEVTLVTVTRNTRSRSQRCWSPLNEQASHWNTLYAQGSNPRSTFWDMWSSNEASSCDSICSLTQSKIDLLGYVVFKGTCSRHNMHMGPILDRPPEISGLQKAPSKWNAAIFRWDCVLLGSWNTSSPYCRPCCLWTAHLSTMQHNAAMFGQTSGCFWQLMP